MLERSCRSLVALVMLVAPACGGSAPAPASPDSTPAVAPEASAAPAAPSPKPAGADESGWDGENAAKSGDAKPASDSKSAPTAEADAAPKDAKGPETRTMDVIAQIVKENRKPVRKCYEDARKELKDLKGDVVIHFVLDPEGNVKSAELNQERSTLKAPTVVDCAIKVIKGIKFPKSSRAMETTANYPFNFTP